MGSSIVRVPTGRRVVTALFVPIFLATLFASTLTAATPASALGASPRAPTVVSPKLTQALAKSRDGSVAAVITAFDRRELLAIRRLGIRGTELRILPMLLVKDLDQARLTALQRSGLVRSVYPNTRYKIQMEDSTWIVGARYVWGAPHSPTRFGAEGYRGAGVDVAVIDTGVDGKHEDTDNLVEFCDTTAAASGTRSEVICAGGNDRTDSAAARAVAFDDEGHGSHVSGTVAGSGDASGGIDATHSTIGIAPEADLHVYSANVGPALLNFQILAAYDDMTYKKINENSGVVATSNSFGGGDGANYSQDDPQNVAIKAAYDANILSVYAAGNSGPEHNTLSDSCINPYVVCVGATTKPDSVVQFSSRGRPSEPADTNRNGIVGDDGSNGTTTTGDDIPADVAPDNHDRRLGQRLGIGLYRPTLVAPGVNINSISANAPACKEAADPDTGCYESLNGTSMATPHVSGAIGVIVQAYRRAHGGRTPNAATIIDILERSAAMSKLPGYESEEQGAGRLNVLDAVRIARGDISPPKPNFGTPSPVYASGKDPRSAFQNRNLPANTQAGCTGAFSFTAGSENPLDAPADQPPESAGRAAQNEIVVPVGAERLRITAEWPEHPGANLYLRLWRPGVNPNAEFSEDFSERAFPDQESIGLADTDAILGQKRFLDVRAPEAGVWRLRVYHRIGGAPGPCDPPGAEVTGYAYQIMTEIPVSARVPTVAITSPAAGSDHTGRYVFFNGTAGYPQRWDGVTNYEVPGTGIASGGPAEDTRLLLHFQGNTEEGCSGDGFNDGPSGANICDGPFLLTKAALDDRPAASYNVPNPIVTFNSERDGGVPNWIWDINSETTLRGPMNVKWWASCSACGPLLGSADWIIRIYADGKQQFEERVTETPSGPDETTLLSHDFDLPEIRASDRFVLHIEPVYIDSQNNVKIYYDSQDPCPTNPLAQPSQAACDSTVRFPVVDPNNAAPNQVENLRVTDVHSGLRIAWDPANGSTKYEVHRSTNPAFTPSSTTRLVTTTGTGCTSPNVPSWTSASDGQALCFTDTSTATLTTYYYRIIGKNDAGVTADPSLLAYGTETQYDRQVKVKADRLYGPGYWEYARITKANATGWKYALDTFERDTPNDSFIVSARSFTQGIGSANANRTVDTIGEAPSEPRDPAVALTKTGPLTAIQGSTITYRISYENFGPEAASTAKIIDALPSSVTFVSATGGGTYSSTTGKVTWRLGTVSVGETGSVTLKVKVGGPTAVPDGTTITNTATFKAPLTVATPGVWFTVVE